MHEPPYPGVVLFRPETLGRHVRTGTARLPLHGGKAPAWLFSRMRELAREITLVIVSEYGPVEMLRRLSDPSWFQAFGCVLGFDWHSSGLTTTVCGALKEGLRGTVADSGLIVAGGKGATSRKTPAEIVEAAQGGLVAASVDPDKLVYASKMSAKVDSTGVQDGYQLYHHTFVFTPDGAWTVIQQGMNSETRTARRYHWLSESVTDFVVEPHAGVASEAPGTDVLNMVAADSDAARDVVTELSREAPDKTIRQIRRLRELADDLALPRHHDVRLAEIHPDNLAKAFLATYERPPSDFEALLATPGVGPKTVRALSLIAELVHGTPASHSDPVLFSFAHGGKDGFPYPVDRANYDRSTYALRDALSRAKLGRTEKLRALGRLVEFERRTG